MAKPFVTRFAPSPSGHLHLGHAYSALLTAKATKENFGRFILRIEDIDTTRCRPEFEQGIYQDLDWLGLKWETPVRRQSDHFGDYKKALERLDEKGLVYPCFCTRKDIQVEINKSSNAPHGPDGFLYPGICRRLKKSVVEEKITSGIPFALRLNVDKSLKSLSQELQYFDKGHKCQVAPNTLGDVVIARKDVMTSYHLAVVVDDHLQQISHVIRGEDLSHATHIHCLIQALLGYDTPSYYHHPLLVGADGKRFAKRDKSLTLKSLRDAGKTQIDIKKMIKEFGGDLDIKLGF